MMAVVGLNLRRGRIEECVADRNFSEGGDDCVACRSISDGGEDCFASCCTSEGRKECMPIKGKASTTLSLHNKSTGFKNGMSIDELYEVLSR